MVKFAMIFMDKKIDSIHSRERNDCSQTFGVYGFQRLLISGVDLCNISWDPPKIEIPLFPFSIPSGIRVTRICVNEGKGQL